jgi:hypothetical protein
MRNNKINLCMKLRPHIALAVFLAALAPLHAMAQNYAGASGGGAQVDMACADTLDCDQHGTAFRLFVGHTVSPNFALEAAYADQRKVSVAGLRIAGELRSRALGVYLLLIAPFGERASLTGKLGVVAARIDLHSNSALASSASGDETRLHLAWGVGIGWEFSPRVGCRLELDRQRAKFRGERVDIDLVTASLLYRF